MYTTVDVSNYRCVKLLDRVREPRLIAPLLLVLLSEPHFKYANAALITVEVRSIVLIVCYNGDWTRAQLTMSVRILNCCIHKSTNEEDKYSSPNTTIQKNLHFGWFYNELEEEYLI